MNKTVNKLAINKHMQLHRIYNAQKITLIVSHPLNLFFYC